MSETGTLGLRVGPRIASASTLKNAIESAIERKSSMSIVLSDSTIGVNLDTRGDWTISIGLSLKSDRFRAISSGLEGIGFFQATEKEGTSYFLWTSVLKETENGRTATEQILTLAVKILQATPISLYIS